MALLERLQILIDADAKGAQKEFEQIGRTAEREVGKAERSVDKLAKKMQSIGATTAIGGAAVVGGFALLAKAADGADRELIKLENSIKNSDQAFAKNGKSLTDLAGALQQKTAADADAIIGSQSLLVQFGLTEAQVKTLTPLVVDLSRKMGVDLDQAAKAVGKAVDGSGGALSKMGISLDGAKLKADGFNTVVEGLRGSVAGFAQQEGQTFSGQLERLKNNLGDIGESVGKGAAGVLGGLTEGAANLAAKLNEVNPGILAAVGGIGATGGIVATLAGGFTFAAGKALDFASSVRAGDTALMKVGENGERSLTKVGKAASAIAIVGAIAGIVETVATVANAANDIDRKTTKAFDGLRGALRGTDADAAKAFATLVNVEDQTARFSGIWEGFGKEFKLGNISADVEEFNRSFDTVLDNLGPEAASKIIAGLEAQNNALDQNSQQYKTNADIIAEAKQRTQDRTEALKVSTVAEREQKKALQESVDAYDRASGTLEGVKSVVQEYTGKLKYLRLEYDANAAAAKGFGDSIERSTTLDDQVGAALSFNDALTKNRETLRNLPKDIDAVAFAFNGVGDASNSVGEEAVKNFLAVGEQAKALLQSFIQAGDFDGARQLAATLRQQITTALQEQGFTPEQINEYLNLAGVSETQVEVGIRFANAEAELLRVNTLIQLFQKQLNDAPPEVLLKVNDALVNNDLAGATELLRNWVAATSSDPNTSQVGIAAIIAKYPDLAPVLAAAQAQANKTPIQIPVQFSQIQPGTLGSILFGGPSQPAGGSSTGSPQRPAPSPRGGRQEGPGARRAIGGPVQKNKQFLVGEKGPELFVPGSMGRIVPNKELRQAQPPAAQPPARVAVTMPDVKAPVVNVAAAEAPVISVPDIKAPVVNVAPAEAPMVTMPDVKAPVVNVAPAEAPKMVPTPVDVPAAQPPVVNVAPVPTSAYSPTPAPQPQPAPADPSVSVGTINITQKSDGEDTAREVVRQMRDLAFLGV